MSDFVSGFVDEIPVRETKFGEMYSLVINGETYGFGKYAPKFGVGSEIEFDVSWNGNYANVDRDTVNVINNVAPARGGSGSNRSGGGSRGGSQGGQSRGGSQSGSRGPSQSRGGQGQSGNQTRQAGGAQRPASPAGGGSKDGYWEAKEQRDIVTQKAIQYQSSRNAAIELVSAALTAGAVALPAAKAKQWDALLALVDTVTERFEEAVLVVRGEGKKAKPEPVAKGKKKQQEEEDDVPFDDELPDWNEEADDDE